jgi:hypothetical protein
MAEPMAVMLVFVMVDRRVGQWVGRLADYSADSTAGLMVAMSVVRLVDY